MKFKFILALSVLSIFQTVVADTDTENQAKEIEAVEKGLRGSVQFVGDSTWSIQERMQHYGVPGVSIAVIKDFKIHWVKHYGVTDKETGEAVNGHTLFQAGSISKPVAAYGALKLVEDKKLSLDAPVNTQLKGWQIPGNEFTKEQPVALKHLLSHSAGLTVHGFGGYPPGVSVPTTIEVLDGVKPANSAAVRVNMLPETQYRYSGGGYTVMQKLVADVSKSNYPKVMDDLVLTPLNMNQSTYLQPLPSILLKYAAAGYLPNKEPVPGKRHTYPEMAAAGLWTTAEDLAKFAVDVQQGVKADKSHLLSQDMVNRMLTPFVSDNTGLGLFLDDKDGEPYFGHGGWDEGFSADLQAHKTRGYGVVIMTNSNHPAFIDELKNSVAAEYQWHNYLEPAMKSLPISETELKKVVGRYLFTPDMSFSIYAEGGRLFMQYLNGEPMEVCRIGKNQYVRREFSSKFRFEVINENEPASLVFGINNETEHIRKRLKQGESVPFEWVVKGQIDQAEKAYKEWIVQNLTNIREAEINLITLANKLNTLGQPNKALPILLLSNRLFPQSIDSINSLAFHYKKTGEQKKAITLFEKIIKLQPENQQAIKSLKELSE